MPLRRAIIVAKNIYLRTYIDGIGAKDFKVFKLDTTRNLRKWADLRSDEIEEFSFWAEGQDLIIDLV